MTSLTCTPWHALHGVSTPGDATSSRPACPDKHPAAALPAPLACCVPQSPARREEKSHPGLRNFPRGGEKPAGPEPCPCGHRHAGTRPDTRLVARFHPA